MNEFFSGLSDVVIRKLGKNDTVKSFDCADEDLNDFILNESYLYRKALLAVSYVMEKVSDKSHEKIIAFFSLANDRISLTDFKDKTAFNRFRRHKFANEKRLRSYPAVKICRLGVNAAMKGSGIGSFILDLVKSLSVEDNTTGCRFITVDAYADAVPFYQKNGFTPLTEEDKDAVTRLLYFDLNDITDD